MCIREKKMEKVIIAKTQLGCRQKSRAVISLLIEGLSQSYHLREVVRLTSCPLDTFCVWEKWTSANRNAVPGPDLPPGSRGQWRPV